MLATFALIAAFTPSLPSIPSVPVPGGAGPDAFGVVEFQSELAALWRGAACAGVAPDPADRHCAKLAEVTAAWRDGWYAKAAPFLRALVPKDVPANVVYPFGGADLLTALSVFPAARELTILALEPAGDPRTFQTLSDRKSVV